MMDFGQVSKEVAEWIAPALPYLIMLKDKVAEGFGRKIGEDAWIKAKALWSKLPPKVQDNPFAVRPGETAVAGPASPEALASFRTQLSELLQNDEPLRKEFLALWNEIKASGVVFNVSGNDNLVLTASPRGSPIIHGNVGTVQIINQPPAQPHPASAPEVKSSTAEKTQTGPKKTFRHNLPYDPNPFLTGRDAMLEALHTALHTKTAAAITQPQTVHGLGGVGKTQLAIEYAWKFRVHYDAALWVRASSVTELHANIAALAARLNLAEAQATQQEVKVEAVKDWLCGHERWLLILDNADTKDAQTAITKLLPTGLHGHVIVTSRLKHWPAGFEGLEVSVLPEDAAMKFLLKRARLKGFDPGSEADALLVVQELGCLPLALEQAGAYMRTHSTPCAKYLALFKESRARLLKAPGKGGTDYQLTVATTWLVNEQQLSSVAKAVLQMAAFLAPDDIPRAMFIQGGAVIAEAVLVGRVTPCAPPAVPDDSGDTRRAEDCPPYPPAEIEDALAELGSHSLVELESETFSCHRLVQAALLDRLKAEDRQRWAESALKLVNDFAPAEPGDVRTWPVWNGLRPHAAAIVKEFWGQANTDAGRLMNELAQLLHSKALYAEAEPLMRRVGSILEKSLGMEHPNVATSLNNLALLLQATNRLAEAEPLMRRALAIDEQSFGTEHPNVAIRLNNLAQLLQDTNRLAEAEPLMRRVVSILEKSLGMEHPNVATSLNNLALLLQDTNRLAEAEPLMRRALAIDEQSFGTEHPNVAIRLNNLAQLLQDTNRLAETEPLMRRALAIDEQSFGTEHPNVAIRLNNLASLLQATNRLAEAEPLMRRALAIDEQSFGTEHPKVAIRLNNLASLLQATNRLAEAEPLIRRALAIDEQSFGTEHPNVARNLNNLALLLKATNRLAQAEPLMRRALAIDEQSFGTEHPNVARNLNNLAQLLKVTNRLAEAEPLMRRVVSIFEKSLGMEHPKVATSLNNLAQLLKATNRLAEAEPLMRRALAIDEQSFGTEHPDVARDLNNLAQLLQDTNRLPEAEPLMRRALKIFQQSLGLEHPSTKIVEDNYKGLLAALNLNQAQIEAKLREVLGK